MSKPSNDNPNKIQGVEITALSVNPLIGIMMLDTDNGPLELAINEAAAEMIIEELSTFLDTDEDS